MSINFDKTCPFIYLYIYLHMKKIVLTLLVFVSTFHLSSQNTPIKILFIGNSYTGSNNLPGMFKQIADNTGDSILESNFSGGGQTLRDHSNPNGGEMMEIRSGKWDVIVLQEQSQLPSFPENQVQESFYPYAHFLDSSAKAANPCVKVLFYMTWGRKNGDAQNCANFPPICTYNGMDSLLRLRYTVAAQQNHSMISPVGPVRKYLKENRPEIELYEPDESHPSYAGTYAAACCFYTTIFQKSALNIRENLNLDSITADHIKRAVDSVVLLQKDNWLLDAYTTKADFTTYKVSNLSIQFNNQSNFADSFFWDMGDGYTTTEKHPKTHLYKQGTYTIKLKAFSDCGGMDSFSQQINVQYQSIDQVKMSSIKAYPNPSNDKIEFHTDLSIVDYTIYNALGTQINQLLELNGNNYTLHVSDFPSGIYTIVIQGINGQLSKVNFVKI